MAGVAGGAGVGATLFGPAHDLQVAIMAFERSVLKAIWFAGRPPYGQSGSSIHLALTPDHSLAAA